MLLHTRTWGKGNRVAVLLHGRLADGRAFHELGPVLAEHGYRAVAVDLPGHGGSPPDPDATLASAAAALRRTVPEADLAIGHSLGGMVLAEACGSGWRPGRAVYIETALSRPVQSPASVAADLADERRRRTAEWLLTERAHWRPGYIEAEIPANQAVHLPTAGALTVSTGGRDLMPPPGVPALAVRAGAAPAQPPDDVARLQARGIEVRYVAGAGHSIWYSHFPEFMTALDGWY